MNDLNSELSRTMNSGFGPSETGRCADTVILVHGLATHKLAMWPLARYLRQQGYSVINWGYPSIMPPIEHHARRLAELLESLEAGLEGARYHLVTHSMGSIIARTALAQLAQPPAEGPSEPDETEGFGDLTRLQHVVMLGPPNHGSPVARVLAPYLGWLCPPLHQLADDATSYVNCLGLPRCGRWGIVAAERDYVVPLRSTCLQPETDHIVVPGRHTGILFARRTAEEVEHFLKNGTFRPDAKRITSLLRSAESSRSEVACSSP